MKKYIFLLLAFLCYLHTTHAQDLNWEEDLKKLLEEEEQKKKQKEEEESEETEEEQDQRKEKEIFKLEDNPKEVYSAKTTFWIQKNTLKYNRGDYQRFQQTIDDLHRFTILHQHNNKFQNLGNNGTALRSIFISLPKQIGARYGISIYDPYFVTPENLIFYNTKSPYVNFTIIPGAARKSQSIVKATYSQNIFPNWNIASNVSVLLSDKMYLDEGSEPVNQVKNVHFDFSTHFKTPENIYQILLGMIFQSHTVNESGGISILDKKKVTKQDFFEKKITTLYKERKEYLETKEYRQTYHLYHQFYINPYVQLFHEFYWRNQFHKLAEIVNYQAARYMPRDPLTINMWNSLNSREHELGCKGEVNKWFYLGYYKNRKPRYRKMIKTHKDIELESENEMELNAENSRKDNMLEHYIGGAVRYKLFEKNVWETSAEYLFHDLYDIKSSYSHPYFVLGVQNIQFRPSILEKYFDYRCYYQPLERRDLRESNKYQRYYIWNQENLKNTKIWKVTADVHYEWPILFLKPYVIFINIQDYIYFSTIITGPKPKQYDKDIQIITPGIEVNWTFWDALHIDNDFKYTNINNQQSKKSQIRVIHIPEYFLNSSIYYQNRHFEDRLEVKTGVDIHFISQYLFYKYEPRLQQFHLSRPSDEAFAGNDVLVDAFLNFKIKRFAGFLKVSQSNTLIPDLKYFAAPYYPGEKIKFTIGCNWTFFE